MSKILYIEGPGHIPQERPAVVKPTRVTNRIRSLRFRHGGMTQAELADRIGVTQQTIIAGADMKAIVQDEYGSADVLELREIDPPRVGDDEVLVRVHAAGLDPGVWVLMTGQPYLVRLMGGFRRPKVAVRGRDLAGVVEAVGPAVTRFRPGDEVYGTTGNGSYAEYTSAPERQLAAKPGNLSFEQAAAVPVSGATARQAVRAGGVTAGQRVMVVGAAGGVGSFAVQIAKAAGATVTGVCSTAKVDLVRSLGADDVIDYTRAEVDRDGARYDVVIDIAGGRPLSLLRRALTPKGTLVLVGNGRQFEGGVTAGFGRQMLRAPLLSMFVGQRLRNLMARERADDLDELRALIESGAVTPAIGRRYALADAPDAIRHLAEGHATGKTVITIA